MQKLIVFAFAISLISQSSCRKVYDFIRDHPDAHDSLCRITRIYARGYFGHPDTFNIAYNAKGSPLSMLATGPYGTSGNLDQYFRYDRYNRLTDYLWTFIKSNGALVWHKYGYPRPNFVTDTVISYTGEIHGPSPIAASSYYYYIVGYTLDAHDRIERVWGLPNDPHEPPQPGGLIIYDANGNLPPSDSGVVYDNMVNPYRTNKVWQFVYNDYSRNNQVLTGLFAPTPIYNSFGLPVSLPNLNIRNYIIFFLSNTDPAMQFEYACSPPKGPINY